MAIVPRINPEGVTRVEGLPSVRDTVRRSDDPLGGLAGVSRAFEGVLGVAGKHFEAERDRNDTALVLQARKELSDWENGWFDPANPEGLSKYRGTNALGADEAAVPAYDSRAAEIRARLNPRQQQMFDPVAFNVRESVTNRLQTYMRGEHERALDATNKATVSTLVDDAIAAGLRGDEDRSRLLLVEAVSAQERVDTQAGMSQEVIAANRREIATAYHAQRLDSLIDTDWAKADEYLRVHRDAMSPKVAAAAESKLRPIAEQALVEEDVGALFSGRAAAAPAGPAARAPAEVQSRYAALGDKHGFVTTSITRSREENAKVDGVAGSQHLASRGTARDWSVKGKTPEQIEAFAADLRAQGFEVITKPHGTGPHIHAELPPGKAAAVAAAASAPPASLGEALSWVRSRYQDPRTRQKAEAEVRSRWSVMEADRADGERQALERMREKVEAGTGTLRERLGGDYAEAVRQGWVGSLGAGIGNGDVVTTDPSVYDRFKRMQVTDPVAFAKPQTAVEIMKASGSLGTSHLDDLMGDWRTLNSPKAGAKHADWSTESQRIDRGLQKLGIDSMTNKAERDKVSGQFRMAYEQGVRARVQTSGKELTPAESDAVLLTVTQNFGRRMAEGTTSVYDTYNKFALGGELTSSVSGRPVSISAADRAVIEAELRRRNLPVTEAAIVRLAAESLE